MNAFADCREVMSNHNEIFSIDILDFLVYNVKLGLL